VRGNSIVKRAADAVGVAWPGAELSAVPPAGEGIKSVQTSAAGITLVDQTG